jgi:hypothetical protein
VLLSEADGKKLLFQDLKSGKDLIQTPFGNLPTISEKVGSVVGWTATPRLLGLFARGRAWRGGGGRWLLAGVHAHASVALLRQQCANARAASAAQDEAKLLMTLLCCGWQCRYLVFDFSVLTSVVLFSAAQDKAKLQ